MEAVADLAAAVEARYFDGVATLLEHMSPTEVDEAGRWYRRKGRALARRLAENTWNQPSVDSRSIQVFLALSLAQTPQEAATNWQFGRSRRIVTGQAAPVCATALIGRGPDWVAEFVELATAARARREGGERREMVAVLSAAIAAYDLPVPLTETYAGGWIDLISGAHVRIANPQITWQPLTLMTARPARPTTAADAKPEPAYRVDDQLTLLTCLASSPAATELLVTGLGVANLFKAWVDFTEDGWQVAPTVSAGISASVLERQPLLAAAFAALSRDDKVSNQRVIAEILRGLDLSATEVRERIGAIVHMMATVHGSVTRLLLDLALRSDLEADDLIDLGTVILARPEKAQKVTLVDHLATSSSPARQPLLAMAAASEDATLAARARALLPAESITQPALDSALDTSGLPAWTEQIDAFRPDPFAPYSPSAAGLDQARSDEEAWSSITQEAANLDLVVRFGHRDLAELRSHAGPRSEYSSVRTPFMLHRWVQTGDPQRSYDRHVSTSAKLTPDGWVQTETVTVRLPEPALVFTDQLVAETLPRLGDLGELLSTPTHEDGTLELTTLAARVKAASGYGPYDLVQALFRVGPTDPADVRLFEALTLPPVEGSTEPDRDGVAVIRGWIAAGGWQQRQVEFPGTEPHTSALSLPLPEWLLELDGVAALLPAGPYDKDHYRGPERPSTLLGVCPWDVEHLATRTIPAQRQRDSSAYAEQLPVIAGSAGPIGPAVHHHVARLVVHPVLESRLLAARYAGWLANQGRLDPELFRARNLALFDAGELSVTRAAHGWSQLAMNASLSVVWPSWVALLDAASAAVKKPAGLADLLRATREFVPVVSAALGADWVPDSVRQLAQAKGKTKAVIEAQALMGTLTPNA